jgi:predicted enzyme related to lactoylglutathione lyase
MKVLEAAFFGYPSTNLPRSREFYEGALGLTVTQEPGAVSWMEFDLGNATLGVGAYPDWKPSADGAMVAFEVDNFEQAITELRKWPVTFHMEPLETPVCHFAIVRDPDGNPVMIHKRKPGHN